MKNNQRTSIDDLDAIGGELSEEHLRLAAGGKPTGTVSGTIGATSGKVDGSLTISVTFP